MNRQYVIGLLLLVATWVAHAQLVPNLFGTGAGAPVGKAPTGAAPTVPTGTLPDAVLPAVGVAANPPAPRDQLVVVSPAPPGRMFGSQLFGGTFRGTLNHGFNPDYVLAPGDRLTVRLWGAFNFEGSLVVDQQGNIFLPGVGPVMVAGVKSGELNGRLEAAVRRVFKANTFIYAALDASQPVKVYVTGFVRQPGLYGGLASDSPIAFLDKAGGIDPDRGSYVDVLIKRGNQIRKRINLYDFLLEGKLDLVQFQDGDVILVQPRKHTFSVSGEVYNANDFEFPEASIPLSRALAMAKVKPGATHVSIVRRQGSERRSEYYQLAQAAHVMLEDGDHVNVTADRFPGTILVRIEGAHAGEHTVVLPYGAKLKDVLAQIRPNSMSRVDAIQLYRKSVQAKQKEMLEFALRKVEETALSARSKTAEEAGLRGKEADLLLKFVERARRIQPKGQVVLDDTVRDETLLEDGDVIVIPERTSLVMVHGEVLIPSAISWREGLTVEDVIAASGGYTQGSDTSKVVVVAQNGAARLAEGRSGFFSRSAGTRLQPGDEVIVLPKIETKNVEVARALTQIIYQIAFTAKVAFGL